LQALFLDEYVCFCDDLMVNDVDVIKQLSGETPLIKG
jgi:hypothetical protein